MFLSEIVPRVGLLVRSVARRGRSVGWLVVELDSVVSTTEQVASSTDEESNGVGIAEKGMISIFYYLLVSVWPPHQSR